MDSIAQDAGTKPWKISRWLTRTLHLDNPERVLVLKIDILLLTWAFVAGLTKVYVSGMKEALSLYGNELIEFISYFSIGYALAIVPSQMIQTLIRPSIFLPACEVIWGLLTSYVRLTVYALQFLLGIFESWPGLVNTPAELGKRLAICGVSGVAGSMFLSILQAALYKNLNGAGGLEVSFGCITVFWGLIGFLIIPDSPNITRALWLTRSERRLAVTRMEKNDTETSKLIDYKKLFRKAKLITLNPLAWLYMTAYLQFAWSQRANSYFLLYLEGLTKATGKPIYSTYIVNLIPLGGYAISIVSKILLNAVSDWKQWRIQIAVGTAVLQIICCAVLSAWPDSTPTIMAFYFLTFAPAAWEYSLLAWLGEILRKEPEARSLLVGASITIVSLRTQSGSLATAFAGGSIVAILGMWLYLKSYFPKIWPVLRCTSADILQPSIHSRSRVKSQSP
ncbi:major facilitator superfamily domain-containing protein [Aspergillus undulatus]|uniref:major facilitator superfamily domain-containing protein n=1 Tax=Aspergillus undulatus TaxID=1810928 RepID=UPI003CCD5F13